MVRINENYIDSLVQETLRECNDWLIVESNTEECIKLIKYFANKINVV